MTIGCGLGSTGPVARSANEVQALTEVRELSYKRLSAALARLDSVQYEESVSLTEFAFTTNDNELEGTVGTDSGDHAQPGSDRDSGETRNQVIGSSRYVKTQSPVSGIHVDSTQTVFHGSPNSVVEELTESAFLHNGPRIPFELPPAFVSAKRINDYSYARSDTLVDGTLYLKYVISRIGESVTRSPTTTLLVANDSTREVVRVIDRSRSAVFLFSAENDVDVGIVPVNSTWLPARFRFALNIKSPFRKERFFVVDKNYSYR